MNEHNNIPVPKFWKLRNTNSWVMWKYNPELIGYGKWETHRFTVSSLQHSYLLMALISKCNLEYVPTESFVQYE